MVASTHLQNYSNLVDNFLEFLTVAIHLILYERDIYPQRSFLKTRKYNYPVRQNRHPAVCRFIDDAVDAVKVQLMKCVVSSVSVILISPAQIPLERYVFSTTSFPIVRAKEHHISFRLASDDTKPGTTSRLPSTYTPISDLHTQYTAVFTRLSTLAASLQPLPADSTFTLAIELRERPYGEPPIGWPMPFMPVEPGLQRENDKGDGDVIWTVATLDEEDSQALTAGETSSGIWSSSSENPSEKGKGKASNAKEGKQAEKQQKRKRGELLGGTKVVPVRNVEAGPFVMEVWVESNRDDEEKSTGSYTGYKSASVEDE